MKWLRRQITINRSVLLIWSAVLTSLLCWPFFQPGALILRDMFVPAHPALTQALFSSSSAATRALPQDAILAVVGTTMSASLFVKCLIIASFVVGCWGASDLVRSVISALGLDLLPWWRIRWLRLGVHAVAMAVTVWNPFVVERLLQGQWSLVMAGVLLPAVAALSMRRSLWMIPIVAWCGFTPTGIIVASLTALIWGVGFPRWGGGRRSVDTDFVAPRHDFVHDADAHSRTRRGLPSDGDDSLGFALALHPSIMRTRLWVPLIVSLGAIISLPWLLPALFGQGQFTTSSSSASAFAARAEYSVGTLGALLGLGGAWNSQTVPASRDAQLWPWCGVIVGVLFLAVLVIVSCPNRRDSQWAVPAWKWTLRLVTVVTCSAIAFPALAATPPGLWVMERLISTVPGAGLIRDMQKFVVLALPGYVTAVALVPVVVSWICERYSSSGSSGIGASALASASASESAPVEQHGSPSDIAPHVATATMRRWFAICIYLCGILVIANNPTAPKDVSAAKPAQIPAAWQAVTTTIANQGTAQDKVLILPPGSYREMDGRPVVEPASKLLAADVINPGALIVDGKVLGIDNRDDWDLISKVVVGKASASEAYSLEIRWVLIEGSAAVKSGSFTSLPVVEGKIPVVDSPDLVLFHVTSQPQ